VTDGRYNQFEVTVPADADYLKDIRRLVSTFAAQCGADDQKIADLVLAANEAATNVVLHAYGNDGGPLRIRGWQAERGLTIEVDVEGPGEYGTRLEMTFTWQ
jgi:anti-sigma regulatory factor (Ser/Thr protein kinase)